MARTLIGTLLLVIAAGASIHSAPAATNTSISGSGPTTIGRPKSGAPLAILIYATANSELSKLLTSLSVDEAMKKAGYQPTFASSVLSLTPRCAQGRGMSSSSMAPTPTPLDRACARRRVLPQVVPVLTRATKEEAETGRKGLRRRASRHPPGTVCS